jgi:small conductance mechanosensitive channel
MPRIRRSKTPQVQTASRARALTLQASRVARRARYELAVLVPLVVGVLLAFHYREDLFGLDTPIRIAAAIAMVILGWALARDLGRWILPALFRRMDAATAGTIGFLVRLLFLVVAVLMALRLVGLAPRTLAVGGAITAVVFGLAAQQTLGNLIAGLVLISARPFRVGDRIRLHAGGIAGTIEGVVRSQGLLYTVLGHGRDSIMIPNNVVLAAAVVPLREPSSVDLRARLRPDVRPSDLQGLLQEAVKTPMRDEPHIGLEELDADEVVMRIEATPLADTDGRRLADEILASIAPFTREGLTEERELRRDGQSDGKREATVTQESDG